VHITRCQFAVASSWPSRERRAGRLEAEHTRDLCAWADTAPGNGWFGITTFYYTES